MTHHTYRGCIIWRNTEPGYRLRYTSMTPNGSVAAQTLADIKHAITEILRPKSLQEARALRRSYDA